MAGGYRIEIDDRLTGPLARLKDAGGDLRAPMAEISEVALEHTEDRYRRQVDPDEVPWEPRRNDDDPGRPILQKDGHLLNALESDSGDDWAAVGVNPAGAPAAYAQVHQWSATIRPKAGGGKRALKTPFGPRGSVTIPARRYLGIEDRDVTAVEAIVLAHLEAAAAERGRA